VKHDDLDDEYLALQEAANQELARTDFLAFYMRQTGFFPPKHFRLIAKLLQAMEEDRIDRAMLMAPPRHIKSLGATILFPAWIMGRHPSTALMSVVHTQHYASKIGRNVRNQLLKPQWPFPDVQLSGDSTAREQWATPQGGEYNGFGAIGGNQHGNPAEWLFMDDLVKGRKIAMSPHMREEIWETYKTDLLSRLQGRRKQLLLGTRWHQDDPMGRILPESFDGQSGWYKDRETNEKWFVLCLQAVAEHANDPLGRKPGEWLWPEAFGEAQLGGTRKRGGPMWSALFQQRPSPEEGLMFTKDHWQRYIPGKLDITRMQIYGASDYAVTEEGTSSPNPDWTVHQVWACDEEMNLYLLDMWRGRTTPDVWVNHWIRLVLKHKPLRWFEESGQIIRAVGPLIRSQQIEHRAWVDRVQITSATDKPSRAQTLLGLGALGKIFLPWPNMVDEAMLTHLQAFETEMLTFPAGTKDDTVDTATLLARGIDRMVGGTAPRKPPNPAGETLDELFERSERDKKRRW
jgi:predicted phage terminase large subunit-like protein